MSKPKRAHRSVWNKKAGRNVCTRCGLVHLRNEATARALKAACPDDLYDPEDERP